MREGNSFLHFAGNFCFRECDPSICFTAYLLLRNSSPRCPLEPGWGILVLLEIGWLTLQAVLADPIWMSS